jgi:hypothetical protein
MLNMHMFSGKFGRACVLEHWRATFSAGGCLAVKPQTPDTAG